MSARIWVWVPRPSFAWAGWLIAPTALLGTLARIPCPAQETVSVAASPRSNPKGPTGIVTGTVYCADTNAPARLAPVYLFSASGDRSRGAAQRMGVVDLDGHFVVANLPEGTYHVGVTLPGYLNPMNNAMAEKLAAMTPEARKAAEARLITVTVAAKQPANVSIRLERAAEIEGTVLYDDGSPAIGLQVSLQPKPEKGEVRKPPGPFEVSSEIERLLNASDDHGHYRILGVGPGEYLVSVRVPAISGERVEALPLFAMLPSRALGEFNVYSEDAFRASKAKPVKIETAGSTVNADITIPLSKLHTIRGHIVLKSTGDPPLAGGVFLKYADTQESPRLALVGEGGEFAFYYVPEGSYILGAGASPEPLPPLLSDDAEDDGFLVSGFGVHIDDKTPEGAATLPILVTGDVTGITLSVPDPPPAPPKEPANTPTSESPPQ